MFGLTNTLIRETQERLSDPSRWNRTGGYSSGQSCIVTASFNAAVERSTTHDVDHGPAMQVIREVIENRFGFDRGRMYNRFVGRETADIITFNDHPMTDHADVMWVLDQAEKRTRPFWRKAP
jgi:hypothetical protein